MYVHTFNLIIKPVFTFLHSNNQRTIEFVFVYRANIINHSRAATNVPTYHTTTGWVELVMGKGGRGGVKIVLYTRRTGNTDTKRDV